MKLSVGFQVGWKDEHSRPRAFSSGLFFQKTEKFVEQGGFDVGQQGGVLCRMQDAERPQGPFLFSYDVKLKRKSDETGPEDRYEED